MSNPAIFEAGFNMLCGKLIATGTYRRVFECRLDPSLVVKVENEYASRSFHNVLEYKFWEDTQYAPDIAKWLAPCVSMSGCGLILLQRKARELIKDDIVPDKLPTFLTDIKRENFGFIGTNLVCVDYALTITNASTRLKKVEWHG